MSKHNVDMTFQNMQLCSSHCITCIPGQMIGLTLDNPAQSKLALIWQAALICRPLQQGLTV
jgi:hypothetical protein